MNMKPLSSSSVINLSLLLTTKSRTNPAVFNVSQHFLYSSSTQQSTVSPYPQRRPEEDGRNIRVSVWWDFENCNLPCSANVFRVAQCITRAVRNSGIKGPIQITAFGDVMQISRTNQEALSATGINLTHVPSGGKNSADRSLLVDLMYWVSQNPPPAHVFLISGDRDFSCVLHRLRMNNYNILLASQDNAPSVLCGAATIMWQWSALARGENLMGKHFNQPPDGPYGSWYGHYKAFLEDPFSVTEQNTCSRSDESLEPSSESKIHPIPKAVMKYIRHVVNAYPEGINITQLRNDLTKSNLAIDKDLYGYKKFSRFLLAMPHILKIQSGNDGQLLVRTINHKNGDESIPAISVESATGNEEPEMGSAPKLNAESRSSEQVAEKSTATSILEPKMKNQTTNLQGEQKKQSHHPLNMQETKVKSHATNLQVPTKEDKQIESTPPTNNREMQEKDKKVKLKQQPKKVETATPLTEVKYCQEENGNQDAINEEDSTPEFGVFKRIWIKWFRRDDTNCNDKDATKVDEMLTRTNNIEEQNPMSRQLSESICPALFSPSSHEALIDGKFSKSCAVDTHLSGQNFGFVDQIGSWCKRQGSPKSDNTTKSNLEKVDQIEAISKQPDIFEKEYFWNEMESFINSSQGFALVFQSRNREHLNQQLQKKGPSVLRSLTEGDVSYLVDLLISDKKWVEECDTPIFPFKVIERLGKDLSSDISLSSNGLSKIFTSGQLTLQESGERKHQNTPHTGVPQTSYHKGYSSKPRNEILLDCRVLVDHIVKEYPDGFNMGSFRKLFLDKHGYALDLQKIGYEKLANLLQIMPGVKVESNFIIPIKASSPGVQSIDPTSQETKICSVANSDGESSVFSSKDNDNDSWDELGPVDYSSSKKTESSSRSSNEAGTERREQNPPDYEPLEEDEFSDSEDEKSFLKSETEAKFKANNEESSLLKILESWYSDKDGDSRTEELVKISNSTDSADNILQPPTLTNIGNKIDSLQVNHIRRRKHGKNYSFVSDQPVDGKDKLVDGIIGNLKRPVQEPC